MAALDNPAASALASSDASRTRSLERSLRLLEDEHHHEKERKAELERTVENARSQLRSLSAMRSADKRQVDVLRQEIDTLRGLLHGRDFPPPSAELKQVEAARAVAEARADAAAAQLDDLRDAMQIGQAEQKRLSDEATLHREAAATSSEEQLEAQRQIAELQRALRACDQKAAAQEAQVTLLQGRTDAARERESRANAQVSELRRQLDASQAEVGELGKAHTDALGQATAAAASTAAEAASRAELRALLSAAEARLVQQAEALDEARARAARVDAETHSVKPSAEESEMRPALADALANAERAASWARAALDEERYERRAAEGRAVTSEREGVARRAREEALEEQLSALRIQLREAEAAREASRRDLERTTEKAELLEGERAAMAEHAEARTSVAAGHSDREATLIAELDIAKRNQAEAERSATTLQVALRAQEARALMAEQRVNETNAAMVPLRQQAEHARSSVSAFEQRLSEGSERLATSEARVASLESDLLRVGETEARRHADVAIDAEGQLSQARAEISGWASRQGLLLAQLAAERDSGRSKAAQLVEAQEALASVKQLVLASKEEEVSSLQKSLRAKEADATEVMRRAEHMGEKLALCREELKLRSEQQRLTNEQLRSAQETLRARESELQMQSELSKSQQARADVTAERLTQNAQGTETLHSQLSTAHERIADLAEEVATARAREKRAAEEVALARDEKAASEARSQGNLTRCDSLAEKVRVTREARLHMQQTLDQRESELREARREISELHGRLGSALNLSANDRPVAMMAGA